MYIQALMLHPLPLQLYICIFSRLIFPTLPKLVNDEANLEIEIETNVFHQVGSNSCDINNCAKVSQRCMYQLVTNNIFQRLIIC